MSTVRLQNTHVALRYFGATYHSWEVVKDSEEFSAGTAHISKSGGDELQFTVNCAELLPSAQSCQVELIGKLGPSSHNPRVEILKSDDPNYLETAYLSDRSISNQYRYVPLSEWQGNPVVLYQSPFFYMDSTDRNYTFVVTNTIEGYSISDDTRAGQFAIDHIKVTNPHVYTSPAYPINSPVYVYYCRRNKTGAIVGGVFGGLIGLFLILFGGWYFWVRRSLKKRNRCRLLEDNEDNLGDKPSAGEDSFSSDNGSDHPFLSPTSSPPGEIEECGPVPTLTAAEPESTASVVSQDSSTPTTQQVVTPPVPSAASWSINSIPSLGRLQIGSRASFINMPPPRYSQAISAVKGYLSPDTSNPTRFASVKSAELPSGESVVKYRIVS